MAQVSTPLKTILALYMEAASEALPDGWALANGQTLTSGNQDINPGGNWITPDLRNRFILGADATKGVTLINGGITLPQATITVDDTTAFPSTGRINIGTNIVTYTGKTITTFTGCTGGSGAVSDNTLVTYAGQTTTHADVNAAAGAPGVSGKGGNHEHSITDVAELPVHGHSHGNRTGTTAAESQAHTHTMSSAGAHGHANVTNGGGGHEHNTPWNASHGTGGSYYYAFGQSNAQPVYAHQGTYSADHAHAIANDTHGHNHSSDATHAHDCSCTGGTTSNNTTTGSAQHENRAKFIALVWIVKVKR